MSRESRETAPNDIELVVIKGVFHDGKNYVKHQQLNKTPKNQSQPVLEIKL